MKIEDTRANSKHKDFKSVKKRIADFLHPMPVSNFVASYSFVSEFGRKLICNYAIVLSIAKTSTWRWSKRSTHYLPPRETLPQTVIQLA